MTSIFTKIINREIPADIVYEDDNHIAFLDIFPLEKWHTLVVPKKEYATIFDMPEEEFIELQKIVYRIALHYEKTLDCGINIFQNNKEISWQEIPHVHFHIVPRFIQKAFLNHEVWDSYEPWEKEKYKTQLSLL